MSLRIAHVTNESFGLDTANGVQQAVYCLARAQADIGQSVAVFSRDDDAVNVLTGGSRDQPRASMTTPPFTTLLRQRLLLRYFERRLADHLLAWQPDVVHFHSVQIPQNVALAVHLRRMGVPYCVTVHGALFRDALRRGWLKKTAFHLLFEREYLNESLFIHALSPGEADVIRRRTANRSITVASNGLPPDSNIRPSQPDALYAETPWLRERLIFMFIGRLDQWQKGLDLLVDAFARAALSNAGLVLVGPDYRGSRRRLTVLAERLGIASHLVFRPPAFGLDRANLLAAADIFVHPSRWEGVSLSVLVAAAAERTCLITRAADPLGELERAQAAIVVKPSVEGVAEGLRRAAALSRRGRHLMGTRARAVAETCFTWSSTAATLVDAYRRELGRQ